MGLPERITLKRFFDRLRFDPLRFVPDTRFACWLLVLLVLLIYGRTFTFPFIDYDDPLYVTENEVVQQGITFDSLRWAFSTIRGGNWHPLTWLGHMTAFELSGLNPAGHHTLNVLLHLANVLLFFLLLVRGTGNLKRSLAAAAVFAVHPVQIESVVWIAQLKGLLSAFFWFLAMHAHTEWALKRKSRFLWLTVLTMLLGLAAKPALITLPFVLLAWDFWPLGRWKFRESLKPLLAEKLPLFFIAFAFALLAFFSQSQAEAVIPLEQLPLSIRLANSGVLLTRYLGFILFPAGLSLFFPHPRDFYPLLEIAAGAGLIILFLILAVTLRRRIPELTAGWFWFLASLFPVAGLVQLGSQELALRYLYIPLAGLSPACVWAGFRLASKYPRFDKAWKCLAVFLLSLLVFQTVRLIGLWCSNETLFRYVVEVQPDNYLGHHALARALESKGDVPGALRHYLKSLDIHPEHANAHNNIAVLLNREENHEAAERHFLKAIRVDPDHLKAHNNLGILYQDAGRYPEAAFHYREALRIHPGDFISLNNLGSVLIAQGLPGEAGELFREALTIWDTSSTAWFNFGNALAAQGRLKEASDAFQKAVQFNPDYFEAYNNLGSALMETGKKEAALVAYREALRLAPDNAAIWNNLGFLYTRQGENKLAKEHYREALKRNPALKTARANLALLEAGSGEINPAP